MTTAVTNGLSDGFIEPELPGPTNLFASPPVERAATNAPALACAPASVDSFVDANAGANLNPDDDPDNESNNDSWRVEVALRLERYRTRRKPRTPRYPSLLLPFDAPESWTRSSPSINGTSAFALTPAAAALEFTGGTSAPQADADETGTPDVTSRGQALDQPSDAESPLPRFFQQAAEQSAKVIEFPRSAAIPVFRPSDLADPVFDPNRPRIVEAPEILPPPPALGGMLIEPAARNLPDAHEGETLFAPATIAQRVLGALIDGAIQIAALIAFVAIFLRLNTAWLAIRQPVPVLVAALGVLTFALWLGYEFLFLIYCGSTPGLRATGLRLATFDGRALTRRSRAGRVLASVLSALSAGLGYLWSLLDPHALCWHDRITHTYLQNSRAGSQPHS